MNGGTATIGVMTRLWLVSGAIITSTTACVAQSAPPVPAMQPPAATSAQQAPVPSQTEPQPPAATAAQPAPTPEAPEQEGPKWTRDLARELLMAINESFSAGLNPSDYQADALAKAIDRNKKAEIDPIARTAFAALVRDLRDGRAPQSARLEWDIKDGDAAARPTEAVMQEALISGDIAGSLAALEPDHPDYMALKAALAATPGNQAERIARLRANLDRWRWLPRSLGTRYILVNVPAYKLKLMDGGALKSEHRIIVGQQKTSTPQLSATVQGVIFNPSWYVPQSIMKEGLGSLIRSNPAGARAKGYDWTVSGGTIYARQLPGPTNALGYVKLDMPNPHAIFIHDTPAKHLFDREVRTFSHGCIRTDKAMFLAGMLSGYYAGKTPQEIGDIVRSGKTTKIPVREPFPIYIGYFTAAPEADGTVAFHDDIYGRDIPLIALFGSAAAQKKAVPATNGTQPVLNSEERLLN